ncbi:Hsp70 family protein [Acrocarpospora sp. B8E8]|uniref:Hsp70 family protein n=1 Tax=Acrocarpospora sp. B8E8 TaxID=3153572 RepID=UPI00325E9862
MTEPILAVDFGTSTTSAACVGDGRTTLLREPASGSWTWPSAAYLDGATLLLGTTAEQRKRIRPENYRAEFKRDLGQSGSLFLGDRAFAPLDLVTELLRTVKAEGDRLNGSPVTSAVLTVPASYAVADPRRDLMIQAGESVGFTRVGLLYEPIAATLAPLAGPPIEPGSLVLLYDFGGGTFDTALVRATACGTGEVLAYSALDDCGGRDLDALAYADIIESHPQLRDLNGRSKLLLAEVVRNLKHQLSEFDHAEYVFDPLDFVVELHRDRLEKLIAPVIERTIACCAAIARGHTIDTVLMTGGSVRIPSIGRRLAQAFGVIPRTALDPQLAVVQGAAQWAATGVSGRTIAPTPLAPGEIALRWELPDSSGTLLNWRVEPGGAYSAGQELAGVRLRDGSLVTLGAGVTPGRIDARYALSGDVIGSSDLLALARDPEVMSPWQLRHVGGASWVGEMGGELITVDSNPEFLVLELVTRDVTLERPFGESAFHEPDTLAILDFAAGRLLWTRNQPRDWFNCTLGTATTYLTMSGDLHAVEPRSGATRWIRVSSRGRKISGWREFGNLLVLALEYHLVAVDQTSGDTVWESFYKEPSFPTNSALAGMSDLAIIKVESCLVAVAVASGEEVWATCDISAYFLAQVVGRRVLTLADGELTCFDLITGARRWAYRTRGEGALGRSPNSSILSADETVLVLDGDLVGVDLATGLRRWGRPHEDQYVPRESVRGVALLTPEEGAGVRGWRSPLAWCYGRILEFS